MQAGWNGSPVWLPCLTLPDISAELHKMTAIAIAYTSEGFAIAADGRMNMTATRAIRPHDHIPDVNDCQKIFECKLSHGALGCTLLGETEEPTQSFDIASEVRSARNALNNDLLCSLRGFAIALARELEKRLEVAHGNGVIKTYPHFQLCMCGYVENPEESNIIHNQPNGDIVLVTFNSARERGCPLFDIARPSISPGYNDLFGPARIKTAIARRLEGFERGFAPLAETASLSEAASFVRTRIETCITPAARKLEYGDFIGGHIHVATITSGAGFQWKVPPLRRIQTL